MIHVDAESQLVSPALADNARGEISAFSAVPGEIADESARAPMRTHFVIAFGDSSFLMIVLLIHATKTVFIYMMRS